MVSALHAVVDIFAKVGDMLQTALKNLWDMIKDPKKMYENVKNLVSGGWDSLVSGSKALKASATDYGTGVAVSFMQHSKEAQNIQNGQSVLTGEAPKPTAVPVVAPPATKEPKRVPGELSPQVNTIDQITKYAGNLVEQTQPTKSSKSTLKKVTSLDEIAKAAVNVEKQTGYPAAAIVTQWALESGWGQSVSGDYNHFGMTRDAGTSKKYHTVETPEDITYEQLMHYPKKERMTATNADGTPITGPWQGKKIIIMRREFSSYDSLDDAIKDNVRLITSNKRYAGGLEAYKKSGNVEDLLRGIARGGYATGRNYESQLVSISKQSNIAQAISKAKSDGLSADTYVAALVPGAKATSRGEQMSKGIADISPRPVNPATPQQPPVVIAQTNNAQSASLQLPPGARPVSSNRRMEEGRFSRS
jgi:flagellum-specific peptidoglycan hydrolase FlgJ